MDPVGGIFGNALEANQAQNQLAARGVLHEEMATRLVIKPFWTDLVDVDVPDEEAILYEPYVAGGETLLVVRTDRLSTDEVCQILENNRGLIIHRGVPPPAVGIPMRPEEDR